jgi:hypothetical protein
MSLLTSRRAVETSPSLVIMLCISTVFLVLARDSVLLPARRLVLDLGDVFQLLNCQQCATVVT